MLSYKSEVETWYALYTTYNDDNFEHADYSFMAQGYQSAADVHRGNLEWLAEIFERLGYTEENIAEMESFIPHSKELLKEYRCLRIKNGGVKQGEARRGS